MSILYIYIRKYIFSILHFSFVIINNFSDDNFKDQVLRQLHTINLRVIQMSQDINALTANICAKEERGLLIEPENSILDKFSFPLKTELELHELEEYLLDKEHANEFVSRIIFVSFCKLVPVKHYNNSDYNNSDRLKN